MNADPAPLWQPDPQRLEHSQLMAFRKRAEQHSGQSFADYRALHHWSVSEPEAFWNLVWDFCQLRGEKGGTVMEADKVFRHTRWFPQASLNLAENLLARDDDHPALISISEGGKRQVVSYRQLRVAAGNVAAQLRAAGVQQGDRVAGYLPNRIETVVAALGTAWIGAIWSSCSPDFGKIGRAHV